MKRVIYMRIKESIYIYIVIYKRRAIKEREKSIYIYIKRMREKRVYMERYI